MSQYQYINHVYINLYSLRGFLQNGLLSVMKHILLIIEILVQMSKTFTITYRQSFLNVN
jgi:hypothetical protein